MANILDTLSSYDKLVRGWVKTEIAGAVSPVSNVVTIKGIKADKSALESENETAKAGDFWFVGSEAPYEEYIRTEAGQWEALGSSTGADLSGVVTEETLFKGTSDGTSDSPAEGTILKKVNDSIAAATSTATSASESSTNLVKELYKGETEGSKDAPADDTILKKLNDSISAATTAASTASTSSENILKELYKGETEGTAEAPADDSILAKLNKSIETASTNATAASGTVADLEQSLYKGEESSGTESEPADGTVLARVKTLETTVTEATKEIQEQEIKQMFEANTPTIGQD